MILLCGLSLGGELQWLENRTADWRVIRSADASRADPAIVLIDIDNASFRTLTAKLGRWPWTRRVWTELIRYLTSAKARVILFDAIFSGEEEGADKDFAAVMQSAGNVVLPFAFVSGKMDVGDHSSSPSGLPESAGLRNLTIPASLELNPAEWSINAPAPLLAGSATAGANLWTPDADGVTRRLPLAIRYGGRSWATVWLAAAERVGIRSSPPPLDSAGNLVLRWHASPLLAYPQVPLWEMICSIYPSQCEAGVRRHKPEEFRDKIVIIGASAAGSYEVRPTAVSETAPGFFILATAVDNLIHGDGIRQTPTWLALVCIAILSAIPAWAVARYRSISVPLAVTACVLVLYGAASWKLYSQMFWLPMAAPMLAAALSFSGNTVIRYLTVDRELARTRDTLERYVSPQLVRYVIDNLDSFRLDGEKRKLTIFFSDVRSFTTLTEKSDPVRLLKQLNAYLEAMTDIVFRYDGIVDKVIGDGIMAHWGAFTPGRPNAMLAARASLDMMKRLDELNAGWAKTGFPPLDIGIGLNTAEVIFGNVGTGKKVDFTVIGDGVNLAARLESANKEYKTHIIISDATRRELEGPEVRPLGSIVVKGKTEGVEIYELLGLRPTELP